MHIISLPACVLCDCQSDSQAACTPAVCSWCLAVCVIAPVGWFWLVRISRFCAAAVYLQLVAEAVMLWQCDVCANMLSEVMYLSTARAGPYSIIAANLQTCQWPVADTACLQYAPLHANACRLRSDNAQDQWNVMLLQICRGRHSSPIALASAAHTLLFLLHKYPDRALSSFSQGMLAMNYRISCCNSLAIVWC